jgi:hypothetical protein
MFRSAFLFFFIFFLTTLKATSVGNPSAPHAIEEGFFISPSSNMSFRLGYEGNFTSNQRLKQEGATSKRVNEFSESANSGTLTINVLNRLDVFATFGQAKIKANWIIEPESNVFSYLDLETEYNTRYSAGLKAIFFEWGKASVSFGGKYICNKPEIISISKDGRLFPMAKNDFKFWQWQIDGGVSYKIDFFIPYVSLAYSKVRAKVFVEDLILNSNNLSELTMENKNSLGMALGCTLTNSKYFMLNIEARLFDEESYTVSADIRF